MRWRELVPPGAGRNYVGLPVEPTRFTVAGSYILAKAGQHLFRVDVATLEWQVVARDAHDPWLVAALSPDGQHVAFRRGNRIVWNQRLVPTIVAPDGERPLVAQQLAVGNDGHLWALGGGSLALLGPDRAVKWVRSVPTGPMAHDRDRVVVALPHRLLLVHQSGDVRELESPARDVREVALRGTRIALMGMQGLWLVDTERGPLGSAPDLMSHSGVAIDGSGGAVCLGGEIDADGFVTTFRPPARPGRTDSPMSPLVLYGEELRAFWSEGSALLRYRRDTREEVLGEDDRGGVVALDVACDGRVAVGWGAGRVEVYSPQGERLTSLRVDRVEALRFAPDGCLLVADPHARVLATTYATLARSEEEVLGIDCGAEGQVVYWTAHTAVVADAATLQPRRKLAIDGGVEQLQYQDGSLVGVSRNGNVVVYDAPKVGTARRRPRHRVPMAEPWRGRRARARVRDRRLEVFDRVSFAVTDLDGRVLARTPYQGWFADRGRVMVRRDLHRTVVWGDDRARPLAVLQGRAKHVQAAGEGRLVVASLHHGVVLGEHDPLEPPPAWHPELGDPARASGWVVADDGSRGGGGLAGQKVTR